MIVAVVGGKLQGVEACYLARKAGWEVVVIDKKPAVAATGLADRFVQLDVTDQHVLERVLNGVDLVLPALEDASALACLDRGCRAGGIPLAFDAQAYRTSSSKLKSDRLFSHLGIPAPQAWPGCTFPVIAKPSVGSGSRSVRIFKDPQDLPPQIRVNNHAWVVQEYLPGPSYSLEVIGRPGQYFPLQVTDLEMDARWDCKRVIAPTNLTAALVADFKKISIDLAQALNLSGLMDVEAILHNGALKVLEIDARLPSQTPTAVYRSTGLNMVALLGTLFLNPETAIAPAPRAARSVIYEHIRVSAGMLEVCGEHIMAVNEPLHLAAGFFGADEAITNHVPGRSEWVATLIITEDDSRAALHRRNAVIADIRQAFRLKQYRDPVPAGSAPES